MPSAALSLAFFLSGAAGLIFQIVWFHRAALVFGSSLWAVTIVLSSFMGGLAIGNGLAARYGANRRKPLVTYAALEIVVAVAGVVATVFLPHMILIVSSLSGTGSNLWIANLIRLVCAFTILAVPASAMGATLPVLVGSSGRDTGFGVVLGRLYGWNTFGAVTGVLVAEGVLVGRFGVVGAAWTAGALNLIPAGIALAISRTGERSGSPQPLQGPKKTQEREGAYFLLGCAFLSGATLLGLEVLWFRFLTMFVLSTTRAASLMLAVVLAAIALGGLVASIWLKKQPPATAFTTAVAFAAGFFMTASYSGFQSLTAGTQVGEWSRILWFACALTLPTSFLSGVLFTFVGELLSRDIVPRARAAAGLTMVNTIGALAGAPLIAFYLLPRQGMERSFFVLAIAYGLIGVFSLIGRWNTVRSVRWTSAAAGAALLISIALFPFGKMTTQYFPRVAAAYAGDGSQIVATLEGPAETIFLMQQRWMGRPVYSRLVTNGFSMSGTAVQGMRYMRYFAYWPMLFHNGPIERALVICYGVGVTAGAVLDIPSLKTLDVAEISRDIVAMSDVIYSPTDHPLRDKRARLHLEDGRYFLETTKERFDLITGEPPPPRTPGAVNIYSRQYFQLIYDRLAEQGIATYWLPVARPNPGTDVDTIARAFCDVFVDCSLWNATPFDLMLVGSRHATGRRSDAEIRTVWQTPNLQSQLRDVGFEQPEQIGATFVGDAEFMRNILATTPPLTDNFPQRIVPTTARPSLSDPRYDIDRAVAERYRVTIDPTRARTAFAESPLVRRLFPASLVDRTIPFFEWQRVINRIFWEGGKPLAQIEDLDAVLTRSSLRTLPLWVLGSDEVKQRIAESADDGADVDYARGLRALSGRDYAAAASYFARAESRGLTNATVRGLRVYALCRNGGLDEARALARETRPASADERHFAEWIGKTFGVE